MAEHIQQLLPMVEKLNENLKRVSNRVTSCELRLDQHAADCHWQFEQTHLNPAGGDVEPRKRSTARPHRLPESTEVRRKAVEMLHQNADVLVGAPMQVRDVMQAARVSTTTIGDILSARAAQREIITQTSFQTEASIEEADPKMESTTEVTEPPFLDPSSLSQDLQSAIPFDSHRVVGALDKEGSLPSNIGATLDVCGEAWVGVSADFDVSKMVASEDLISERATETEASSMSLTVPSTYGRQCKGYNNRASKLSTPSWVGSDVVKMTSITVGSGNSPGRRGSQGVLSELRAMVQGDIFGTHPAVKEMFEKANTTSLKESVWDVSLFLLYSPLGRGTNCSVLLPVILTIFLQLSFASVVVLFIVNSEAGPLSLQSDFSAWFNNSEASEVMAVCGGDASLTSSFLQANAYETYLTYTETTIGESHGLHSAGPFTCVLVCSAWILMVLQEFGQVMDKILGVWNLTDRRCRVMELQLFQTPTSSGFTLLSIPLHRAT
eukprot:CAMPEP_0194497918 /NCGR_PEP_ID=MMETSP0253-20130528/14712_1 /TAXON_ID=2966 /ORGANISM="Noctiluca scintillans" /LENGTH=493 /DNA_ID=CAMNT_0039339483 /DNA_START=40 /DNA_END=1517 /DNA_ORIENTATION=-